MTWWCNNSIQYILVHKGQSKRDAGSYNLTRNWYLKCNSQILHNSGSWSPHKTACSWRSNSITLTAVKWHQAYINQHHSRIDAEPECWGWRGGEQTCAAAAGRRWPRPEPGSQGGPAWWRSTPGMTVSLLLWHRCYLGGGGGGWREKTDCRRKVKLRPLFQRNTFLHW